MRFLLLATCLSAILLATGPSIAWGSPDEAADVSQEVLQAAYTSFDGFRRQRETDGFRKWLKGITRNKVRDHFRNKQRNVQGIGGSNAYNQLLQVDAPSSHSAREKTNGDVTTLIRQALTIIEDDFQPRTWLAFWRTAIDGLSASSVAEELDLSAEAVRQAKSRVLKRLRDELERLRRYS